MAQPPHPRPLTRDDRIREVIDAFTKAAERFVAKVDAGDAHSIVTYSELKQALELRRSYGL